MNGSRREKVRRDSTDGGKSRNTEGGTLNGFQGKSQRHFKIYGR